MAYLDVEPYFAGGLAGIAVFGPCQTGKQSDSLRCRRRGSLHGRLLHNQLTANILVA